MQSKEDIVSSLSPIERKVLPYLASETIDELAEKAKTDFTTVLRALEYLQNKKLVTLKSAKHSKIILDVNGLMYVKEGLPERRLLNLFSSEQALSLGDAKEKSGLSDNEFQAALGALKKKALVRMESGRLFFSGKKEEIVKKMLEESFLEHLPLSLNALQPEQKFCFEQLKNRKAIVKVKEQNDIEFAVTPLGKEIMKEPIKTQYIEQLTSEILEKGTWKGKSFRKYDITSPVPRIHGGRRQPYYAFLKQVREKLVALGFQEMSGSLVESEFWNYDALFQPQFHGAREWSSTYYVKNKLKHEIDAKTVEKVKQQHEKSWKYSWKMENALKLILRPQGTVLSAKTLPSAAVPGKYFAIARCYRPDVIDAKHLSEFNQVEGIIVQENLTMRNLLAVLELFAKEIAHAKDIRFVPSYFPFTEPSVELQVKHEKFGWMELGGAGIFRREVVKPLTGKDTTVLAWGLGIDRLAMINLGIDDIRTLFSQDIDFLRGHHANN